MLRTTAFITLFALLLAVGCSTQPAVPPDTRAADVQAVAAVEATMLKDMAGKDADKVVSYFADNATGLYPGNGIVTGKADIKATFAPFLADPNFAITFQNTGAVASKGGDMVYSVGTFTMTLTDPKTKKPATEKGKYLTVYMKQADGSWKAVADTYNSNSPM